MGWAGDGELYTTGSNDAGQLGLKGPEGALEPLRVSALEMHNVHSVACGQGHMLAVIDNGQLAAWGSNEYGQLGSSTSHEHTVVDNFYALLGRNHLASALAGVLINCTVRHFWSSEVLHGADRGEISAFIYVVLGIHLHSGAELALTQTCSVIAVWCSHMSRDWVHGRDWGGGSKCIPAPGAEGDQGGALCAGGGGRHSLAGANLQRSSLLLRRGQLWSPGCAHTPHRQYFNFCRTAVSNMCPAFR